MSAIKEAHHNKIIAGQAMPKMERSFLSSIKHELAAWAIQHGPGESYKTASLFIQNIEKHKHSEPVDILLSTWEKTRSNNSLLFLLKAVGYDGNTLGHVQALELLDKIGGANE